MAVSENILIIGGTGLIGEHISNAIVASREHFQRIALFTSANTIFTKAAFVDGLKAKGVEIIVGDIKLADDVREAYTGFDTVISCVGRQVISAQLELIRLADKHPDVKRFFPSEYGTDVEHNATSSTELPHQAKLKVRAALAATQTLEYTYIVTGPYANADRGLFLSAAPTQTEASGSFDVKRKRAVLLGDPDAKINLTTMRDVGQLVVAALRSPEQSKNRALLCNSFTATPNAILAEFEKQTGGEKWDVAITELETLKQLEKEAWAKQDARAVPLSLRRIWTEGGTLYGESRHNGLIGMEENVDTLQNAVEEAIKVQTE
jgi:nucleoside-diphosphate-sugar epimerase